MGENTTGQPCEEKTTDESTVDPKTTKDDDPAVDKKKNSLPVATVNETMGNPKNVVEVSDKSKKIDEKIQTAKEESEANYQQIVERVLDTSDEQLNEQKKSKAAIRGLFKFFFTILLSVQFTVLCVLFILKGFVQTFNISDAIIVAYIGSVFVETLSVVLIMVKFAFDTEQETHILDTLNSAIENYQKYKKD